MSQKNNYKIKDIQFLTQTKKESTLCETKRCCARTWANHYGTRCNYKKVENEDYCKHHLNMIKKNGKLIFNRYDEVKPIYNEKDNRIPWLIRPEIDIVNNLIQSQWSSLQYKVTKDLKKQRYITPKI